MTGPAHLTLERLFEGLGASITGNAGRAITSLTTDSRRVAPGALFFCLRGARADGHAFARDAVAAGAAALVCERDLPPNGVATVVVAEPLAALSKVAARFYGFPASSLTLVGVTGTNGKTTTTYFIEAIARAAGERFGIIGTLGARLGADLFEELPNTTPFAHDTQRLLATFRDRGARGAVLEVSSHALALHRVDDVEFDVAVLTNLTHDHLDFHGTFGAYRAAKRKLFSPEFGKHGARPVAVLNADDAEGAALTAIVRADGGARCLTYGIRNADAHLHATGISYRPDGSRFSVRSLRPAPFSIRLAGAFNVYNALAAIAAACALDVDVEAIAEGLESVDAVPGRMFSIPAGEIGVFVDYAHTPDGLEQVLTAARALTRGRLFCVFGCGGDRDAAKRPKMGSIAQRLADHAIITTDNPRHEEPQAIVRDILTGMNGALGRYEIVLDRAAAITRAIQLASPGDSVVIAGKGHENYQIIGDERRPFCDADVAAAAVAAKGERS
jgi:UDP-N-acetylmuramoyl-L-alanyl-D-glutamate--2,6-diaminopimelate ligase